ncbi:MAG: helix-turn-helix domain-containing protein [Micrococcales bacterium]|nr:helix-turn-helix domain-containing protein [Micrococcales bacterium]
MHPDLPGLVSAGLSDSEIADKLGVASRTVRRWRRRHGLSSSWTPTPPLHGTRSRYVRGCRCDACTAANAAYRRRTRAAYRRALYARQEAHTA